jgi:hypothetical protein
MTSFHPCCGPIGEGVNTSLIDVSLQLGHISTVMGPTSQVAPSMSPTMPRPSRPSTPARLGSSNSGTQTPKSSRALVTVEDQSSRLPFKKLLVVFLSLLVCLLVSFLDQTR